MLKPKRTERSFKTRKHLREIRRQVYITLETKQNRVRQRILWQNIPFCEQKRPLKLELRVDKQMICLIIHRTFSMLHFNTLITILLNTKQIFARIQM